MDMLLIIIMLRYVIVSRRIVCVHVHFHIALSRCISDCKLRNSKNSTIQLHFIFWLWSTMKNHFWSQQKGFVDNGACCQMDSLSSAPKIHMVEPTSTGCPLTSVCPPRHECMWPLTSFLSPSLSPPPSLSLTPSPSLSPPLSPSLPLSLPLFLSLSYPLNLLLS